MFHQLVSHNEDINRLVEKGYALAFDEGYMVIRDIPYLDTQRQVHYGVLVTKLIFVDDNKVIQDDHQVFFAGAAPCGLDGSPIPNLGDRIAQLALSEACHNFTVQRSFSNKPKVSGQLQGFKDFFEKIESYVSIISGPAMELHDVTPYTFRSVESIQSDSPFKFQDTLTSRAEITDLSRKFKDDVVAVIGLGGTGGYVLDFLVKTPVREVRAFDLDPFHVHNAYRSPGRLERDELGKSKAEVYASRYENFRTGLSVEPKFINTSSAGDLQGVTFAFVCVDKGSSRAGIFDLLLSEGIPFIDVGMGLNRKHNALNGMLRATYYSPEHGEMMRGKGLAELADNPNDLYRVNIQIGELNALNACLAVIKFKQLRGFYFEEAPLLHLLFGIGDLHLAGESTFNED